MFAGQIVSVGSATIGLSATSEGDDEDEGDGEDDAEDRPKHADGASAGSSKRADPVAIEHQPDSQFQHREALFPGEVLEVSYSQDPKTLERLAWDYIQHSNGDIKAVIGIAINYKDSQAPSTVSLWRARYVFEDASDVVTLEVDDTILYQERICCEILT